MLGISWMELLVVALGALMVFGPKDLAIMISKGAAWMRSMHLRWHNLKTQFHQTVDQAGSFRGNDENYNDVTPKQNAPDQK